MEFSVVEKERTQYLNDKPFKKGKYILYWMQASQRILDNHALMLAAEIANKKKLPLIVYFGVTDFFPDANYRHFIFMLQGLKEIKRNLEKKGINFIIQHKSPERGAEKLSLDASILVVDRGYLRIQRQWRDVVASKIPCACIQIESDVIVPIDLASNKEEFSAATFRPKIFKLTKRFLNPIPKLPCVSTTISNDIETISINNISSVVKSLNIDKTVPVSKYFKGGTSEGLRRLKKFIDKYLSIYNSEKNNPISDCVSNLSPYLHFGQLSPLTIALEVIKEENSGVKSFLEELIVRRELSMNFVYYNQKYDSYNSIPKWCKKTLSDHKNDKREYIYSLDEFENAQTHDPYWNAAQKQMVITGKMHGYMRIYWGKKIIEWSSKPEDAYNIALYLNNKYELDGRDPNGFTGIAWCFGKHDRPWAEREVFGKIRYMNARGLERKFDIDQYAKKYNT